MTNDQILNAFILKLQAQVGQLAVNNALLQCQLEAAYERIRELEGGPSLEPRTDGAPADLTTLTPPNASN